MNPEDPEKYIRDLERGVSETPGAAPQPVIMRPPDDVLQAIVYPLLRLPGPDDMGGRGRLVPVDARTLYAESAARFGRPIPFDVSSVVCHLWSQVSRSA